MKSRALKLRGDLLGGVALPGRTGRTVVLEGFGQRQGPLRVKPHGVPPNCIS